MAFLFTLQKTVRHGPTFLEVCHRVRSHLRTHSPYKIGIESASGLQDKVLASAALFTRALSPIVEGI